jgi:hypothetical protein
MGASNPYAPNNSPRAKAKDDFVTARGILGRIPCLRRSADRPLFAVKHETLETIWRKSRVPIALSAMDTRGQGERNQLNGWEWHRAQRDR